MHIKILGVREDGSYQTKYRQCKQCVVELDAKKEGFIISTEDHEIWIDPEKKCSVWLENDTGGTIRKLLDQMDRKFKKITKKK